MSILAQCPEVNAVCSTFAKASAGGRTVTDHLADMLGFLRIAPSVRLLRNLNMRNSGLQFESDGL